MIHRRWPFFGKSPPARRPDSLTNMLDRKFDKYIGGPTPDPLVRVHITLSPAGRFFFNNKAHELLGRPGGLYIYFSASDDEIAVQPTRSSMPLALPLLHEGKGWRVNAGPFCRHFRIRLDTTVRFAFPNFTNDGLILKLRETVTIETARRGRKRGPAA